MPRQRFVFTAIDPCRFILNIGSILCIVLLIGCGGNSNLGDVSGKVTINGDPLPDAFITFKPTRFEGVGGKTFGKTASDGTYYIVASENESGAYIGENLVRIKIGDVKSEGGVIEETVPAIYSSKSELLVEVKSGSITFDFELNSTASSKIDRQVDPDL